MQLEHAQKIEEQGKHQYQSLASRTREGTELSKQTRQVPLQEQQETHDELVAQVESPFAPAEKVMGVPSETDYEEATLVLSSVDVIREHSQVPLTVKHPLGRLELQEAFTPSVSDVGKSFEDTTIMEICSERPISPSPHQSGLAKQYATYVPVSSVDELRPGSPVTSPQRTLIVQSESIGQLPTLPTGSKSDEAYLSFATDHTKRVPYSLEQMRPQKDDAGRHPPLPGLYKHVRVPGVTPVRKAPACIEETVHTAFDEPTAPAMGSNSTSRQPENVYRMDNCASSLTMNTSSNEFTGRLQSTQNELVEHDLIGLHKTHPGDNQIPQQHGFRAINRSYSTTTPTPRADHSMSTANVSTSVERANTAELTRADVQEEAKTGRRLMTRTKIGCGTCRKRKRKCDEAKPECKNCEPSGLSCSYVNTKLLPKTVVVQPLPSLQAQRQLPTVIRKHNSRFPGSDLGYILNSEPGVDSGHNTHGDSYPPIESTTGLDQRHTSARLNPQALASTGQDEPTLPRVWYMPRLPTPTIGHNRDVSNKNCQVAYSGHSPRPPKTEKLKMLDGEPFLPSDSQLVDERTKCAGAVHSFNTLAIL
jgi:hypothetical protein